jgi:hypothetical protein
VRTTQKNHGINKWPSKVNGAASSIPILLSFSKFHGLFLADFCVDTSQHHVDPLRVHGLKNKRLPVNRKGLCRCANCFYGILFRCNEPTDDCITPYYPWHRAAYLGAISMAADMTVLAYDFVEHYKSSPPSTAYEQIPSPFSPSPSCSISSYKEYTQELPLLRRSI